MRKFRSILGILIVWIICGCTSNLSDNTNEVPDKNLFFISTYFNEAYDSINKFIVFEDTGIVKTAGLEFYHFYDIRSARRGPGLDGFFNYPKSKFGVFVRNQKNGNCYIYSRNSPGNVDPSTHFFSQLTTNYELGFHPKKYFNHINSDDTFALYRLQQTGVSMKLSAILNDLPKNVRATLSRIVLDSIFRSFFYRNYASDNVENPVKLINDSINSWSGFCLLFDPNGPNFTESNKLCSKFNNYMRRNALNPNLFVYNTSSKLCNGLGITIAINEDMTIPATVKGDSLFVFYDDEPKLYNLSIYCTYDIRHFE